MGLPRLFVPTALLGGRRRRYVCLTRETGLEALPQLRLPAIAEAAPAGGIPEGGARLDAAGRYGLGIHEGSSDAGDSAVVEPIRRPWRAATTELLARPFGLRYVALRVSKTLPADVEKPVARTQRKVFDLLGCDTGDGLVLTSARPSTTAQRSSTWTTVRCQGFEIGDADFARRLEREVAVPTAHAPWLSPELALGLDIDLPRIFVGAEMRAELGVPDGGVVLARREVTSLFARNFREFGLLVMLSVLALSQVPMPVEADGRVLVGFVALSVLLAVVFTGTSIRGRVRRG